MAKRKAAGGRKKAKPARKAAKARRSVKRPSKSRPARTAKPKKLAAKKAVRKPAPKKRPASPALASPPARSRSPRLDRARRTLEETVPSPPSSLNMNRHGSAARTGRAEIAERKAEHGAMTAVTAGDVDINIEQAYFSGDEAPGGDNPTPDQDIVDEIGKAIGVEYQDNEPLRGSDKVSDRDRHRWELDPASAEDYKDRK